MSENKRNLTSGNLYRQMIAFALPLFLSQTFQQLYNTADSFVVGQTLGTNALAAVASSGNLIFLLTSFFDGLAMGAGVVISRFYGAGDKEAVSRAVHTDLLMGLISGAILTAAGVIFTPTLLAWMNLDANVLPLAIEYFRYYFLGALALVMYNICRGIMTAMGDSRRPLYYLIFSSLLNVALDLLFIRVFRWGVWAAAVATVISQAASVVLCMIRLVFREPEVRVRLSRLRLHRDVFASIIRYGVPSGVQNSVIGFANVIVQSQVNLFGGVATAAFGAHSKIEGFAFLPITSFTMAISTFVSQNLGAKQYERAKRGARFGVLAAMVLAETIGVVYFLSAKYLIGFFDSTPEVVAYGIRQARIEALFYCLLALSHAIASVCRGAGRAVVPMTVMLSVWCVFRVAYIYVSMALSDNIAFIYWAYPITWTISSVIFFIYYKKADWVHGFEKKSVKQ